MVIESPVFMVTAANEFLASIPFALAPVALNRPDSVTAPILPPDAVKVLDITICGNVPFVHTFDVARPL
jgi:hypothetical protein